MYSKTHETTETCTTALTRDQVDVSEQLEEAVVALLAARVRNEVEWSLGRILRDEEGDDA